MIDDKQTFVPSETGYMRFYKERKIKGQYLISADVAEGLEKGDYTCAPVFDLEDQTLVAAFHGHIEPDEFGSYYAAMGRHYNNATLAPERNKDGVSVISTSRKIERYPDGLIHASQVNKKERPQDKFVDPESRFGWLTTLKSKPMIINKLAIALIRYELPWLPAELIHEMYKFIRKPDGSVGADGNYFDDWVMATAIGWNLLQHYAQFIVPRQEWNNCATCKYWQKKGGGYGRCERTWRWCPSGSWCRLFSWNNPKTLKLPKEFRDKSDIGHRPLGKHKK